MVDGFLCQKQQNMDIKEVKPINVLYLRSRATLDQLDKFIPAGQRIYKEAVMNNLPITGPLQWHYFNFYGNPAEPFDLEVALPVAVLPAEYDGEFHVKRTQLFKCLSTMHYGDWNSITSTYGAMMKYAGSNGLKLSSHSREIYNHVDFEDPSANVTEIQLGLM